MSDASTFWLEGGGQYVWTSLGFSKSFSYFLGDLEEKKRLGEAVIGGLNSYALKDVDVHGDRDLSRPARELWSQPLPL